MNIILTPGNEGRDCAGNGEHRDSDGAVIEICCDECDYLMCCTNYGGLCGKCFENSGVCPVNAIIT